MIFVRSCKIPLWNNWFILICFKSKWILFKSISLYFSKNIQICHYWIGNKVRYYLLIVFETINETIPIKVVSFLFYNYMIYFFGKYNKCYKKVNLLFFSEKINENHLVILLHYKEKMIIKLLMVLIDLLNCFDYIVNLSNVNKISNK